MNKNSHQLETTHARVWGWLSSVVGWGERSEAQYQARTSLIGGLRRRSLTYMLRCARQWLTQGAMVLGLLLSIGAHAAGGCYQWRMGDSTYPWVDTAEAAFAAYASTHPKDGNGYCYQWLRIEETNFPVYVVYYKKSVSTSCNGIYSSESSQTVTYRKNPDGCYFSAATPKVILPASNGSCKPAQSNEQLCGDPINPATGNTYKLEHDLAASEGDSLKFNRYYNSTDGNQDSMSGWRGAYSRYIKINDRIATYQPLATAGLITSPLYSSESAACTTGFAQIKAYVPNWATATAGFSNGVCSLTKNGVNIGALSIYTTYNYAVYSNIRAEATPPSYDYVSDDGQVIRFSVISGVLTAPPGTSLKLVKTATGFTFTDGNDNVEQYDASGKLLSITSRNGVVQNVSYDGAGRVGSVTDSFGRHLSLSYDTQGRLSSVVNAAGQGVTYGYDSAGRLSTVQFPDGTGKTYLYEYSSFPNALTGLVDESGLRLSTWEYDAQGRAIGTYEAGGAGNHTLVYNTDGSVTVTDALGAVRTFNFGRYGDRNLVTGISGSQCPTCSEGKATTYGLRGFVSSRTDYNNNVTTYIYDDSRGVETSRTEASGTTKARTTTTQWHSTYRLPTLISVYNGGSASGTPLQTTSFTYDASGNQLTKTVTDPATSQSRTWTYTYDTYGRVLTANGPRTDVSDITTYTYYTCTTGYQCGQVATVTNALGQTTTYNTYNAHGQPLTITDPNGVVTTLTYDLRQRLTSRTVGSESTTFAYWPTGLLKQVTLPDGSYLAYTYDAAHRLTQIQDAQGNGITYTLDAAGNRTAEQVFDATGYLARANTRTYDTLSRLYQQLTAAGTATQTTTYGYDANGNPTTINAPLSRTTANQYDELNRLKQVTDPASGITQYGYDANDNLISVTDPRNLTTTYAYNGLGDLTQLSSPDTGAATHTYDAAGNLATRTDARGQTSTYGYDAVNRVTQVAYSDQTQTFGYDQGAFGIGRLTALSDASGSIGFTYTAQGRIASKTQVINGLSHTLSYGYNSAGQLTSLTTPSGQVIAYNYTQGQVTGLTVNGSALLTNVLYEPFGPVRQWTWGNGTYTNRTYDQNGTLTQVDSAGLNTYGFDDAFRITANSDAVNSAQSWSYGYDTLDRLTSANKPSLTQSWTFDANGNRLTEGGTINSILTVATTNNRLASISGTLTRSYTYDAAGNITSDGTRSFTYNSAGRMATATQGGVTTTYSYSALGQRVKKSNANGTTYFVYDEQGHLLGEYDQSGNLIQEIIWLNDIPVATIRTDQSGGSVGVFYIHTDHLNAPTKVTRSSDNQVIWRWDHDPFGNGTPSQDPDGNGLQLAMNLRFPGQYYDQETGLNYNYVRYYDPNSGRYITSDPIGMRGGVNTYAYVLNNPISYIDPMGLEVQMCRQPAFGWMPIDHQWIRTNSTEAGMGGTKGNEAGNQSGDMPGDPVVVTDHTGRADQKNSSCETVPNVDEKKVDKLLELNRPIGNWWPNNQCQSFVRSVLNEARYSPGASGSWGRGSTGHW